MTARAAVHRRELLFALATRDIKTRYMSIKLGAIYTFGVSLATMTVLSIAFGGFFRDRVATSYPLFVFSALIPWNFFSYSVNGSSDCFRQSASIVRKVPFPRELIPLGVVATHVVTLLISLVAFVPFVFLFGGRPAVTWIALPLALLAVIALTAGVAMFLGALGAFFIEVKPVTEVLVMLWFYATPVFYPPSIVPERFRFVLAANPMARLVDVFRDLLVYARWPDLGTVAYCAVVPPVVFLLGWLSLKRVEGTLPDRV